jgi:hypothetical protein
MPITTSIIPPYMFLLGRNHQKSQFWPVIGGGPNEAVISQPPTTGIFIKPERLEQSDYLWLINMYQDWNLIVGDQGSSVKLVVAKIHTMETALSGC